MKLFSPSRSKKKKKFLKNLSRHFPHFLMDMKFPPPSELHHLSSLGECNRNWISWRLFCSILHFTTSDWREKKVFGKLFSCKSCWRRWKIYWILPLPPTPKLLSCGGLDDPGCGGNLLTVFFNLRRWKCLLFFKLLQVLEKQESLQRETRLGMNEIGNMKWINSTMIFLWKPEYSKAEYSNYVELPLHPPLPHHAEKLSGKVRNSSFAVRFTCSCTTSKILIKLLFLFFIKLHAQSAFKQSPEQRQKKPELKSFCSKVN